MGNLLDDGIISTLGGKYLKFDETGKLGPVRVLGVEYVLANDPKYGDAQGYQYLIRCEGDQVITTTSKRLIRALGSIDVGDRIVIERRGEKFETDYNIQVVEKSPI